MAATVTDAWDAITALRKPHVLVADPALDLAGQSGTKLLEKAPRASHRVIYSDTPGGITKKR